MLSFLFMVIITSFVPTSIPTWKYDFSTLWKGNPSLYELIGLVPNMYSGDIHLCSPLFKQFFSTCSKCFHPIFLLNFWTYISILITKKTLVSSNSRENDWYHWRCTICDARWLFLAPEDSQMPWPQQKFVNWMGWAWKQWGFSEKVGVVSF